MLGDRGLGGIEGYEEGGREGGAKEGRTPDAHSSESRWAMQEAWWR